MPGAPDVKVCDGTSSAGHDRDLCFAVVPPLPLLLFFMIPQFRNLLWLQNIPENKKRDLTFWSIWSNRRKQGVASDSIGQHHPADLTKANCMLTFPLDKHLLRLARFLSLSKTHRAVRLMPSRMFIILLLMHGSTPWLPWGFFC
jgi:hypothetical protein